MRPCITFLFFLISLSAISQEKFKLQISFDENPVDSVKLVYDKKIFVVQASNCEAVFEGELERATRAHITIVNSKCLIPFYLEPGVISIKAKVFELEKGGKCIGKKDISGGNMQTLIKNFEKESDKIRKKYHEKFAVEKIKVLAVDIIRANPGQDISVDLVTRLLNELGTDWALSALELIDENIKGPAVNYVNKAAMSSEYLKRGNYIDFTLPALEDSFTLSSLQGKYVLLDFWASWCVPCRKENPKLKSLYEKYKDEGLEIVGVSLDHDAEKWKEAIDKDGLPWIHVSDLKGWQNEVSFTLGIKSIPTTILLNREGRIVDYGLRGNELEKAVEKLISKKD